MGRRGTGSASPERPGNPAIAKNAIPAEAPDAKQTMTRRKFLKRTGLAALGGALGVAYPFIEAKWLGVNRVTLTVRNLPAAFKGKTVAFLTDLHHGPYVPLPFIRHAVDMANALKPDLIALGGDYPHRGLAYVAPCIQELGRLRAPLGVYAVLGNHDHYDGIQPHVSAELRRAGIPELTNRGQWIEADGARLWLCGVGDYWQDTQNLPAALGCSTMSDAVILLSHNPDYVEEIHDPRVGLVLAGHTHGGQVDLPIIGAPVVPSIYGQKYVHGLVQGPVAQVFVSRGIGTITPPVRLFCKPEVVLATLA
jgi:predicted MPP superfamily phosphohydrolase